MQELTTKEIIEISGGDTTIWDFLNNINPVKIMYDFGHDVVYPYIYKPLFK